MRFSGSMAAAAVAVIIPVVLAQTSTDCDPLNTTCPADTGLDSYTFFSDFTQGNTSFTSWSAAEGTTITWGEDGAEFIITAEGQAPTISTDFYFLFGKVEVVLKAATGTGIVSSVVFLSDDLDEIDLEWLGGDTTQVETNFFGKDNTTLYDRATYQTVSTPQSEFHTYTVDWTSERIEWSIDGTVVRTLDYDDALALYGKDYPQTPMQLKLGNWCGGCPGESIYTIEWAGGNTTFADEPYIMYVKSVAITNYNPAEKYLYSDMSGDWESIEIINGSTTASAVGSASVTATPSATSGSGSGSSGTTTTSAPTSSVSVAGISGQTVAAVSTTVTSAGSSTATSAATASYGVSNSTAQGTGSGSGSSTATTEVPGSSASVAVSTSTNVAPANVAFTAGSFLSLIALGFALI